MHVRQSHEMIGRRWCWAGFTERSGVDKNRTVVDAVIPPRQSNEARRRDTKAPCGCDNFWKIDSENSFSHLLYISTEYGSSWYIKVMESRSKSQEQNNTENAYSANLKLQICP